MTSIQTLGDVLRVSWPESSDWIAAVPSCGTVSLDTPVHIVSAMDERGEPVVPEGYVELMPLWRMTDVLSGLRQLLSAQLHRHPSDEEVAARFLVYLEQGA